RRFDDHRHAGEERAGGLLGESPYRKVEGVDAHPDPVPRHQGVPTPERLALAELDAVAREERAALAESFAQRAVIGERARATVDVEGAVRERGAGRARRERQQLVAAVAQRPRHAAQQISTLRKIELPQRRTALLARK